MLTFWNDLRYGVRQLVREPVFSGLAILALTLGIGANTAIFSMINGILLRPLSYRHPEQLYLVREIVPMMGKMSGSWPANLRNFSIWQHDTHSFDGIAVAEPFPMNLTSSGEPREVDGTRVSANLFEVLGVTAWLGRTFAAGEDLPGRDHLVVLTNAFWRDEFHSDPALVGKNISLNGEPYEVIGVLPESFRFPKGEQLGQRVQFGPRVEFFKPMGLDPNKLELFGNFRLAAIARLKPGMKPSQALADLNVAQAQIAAEEGNNTHRQVELRAELTSLESEIIGSSRRGLLLLLASVGAVLLIVCVNLASLLLVRASKKMHAAAIRTVLGASRTRLIGQMLAETLPLSLLGGILGIAAAYLGLRWLIRAAPLDLPRLDEVHIDARVLLFAFALSLLTSILSGLMPAWRCAHADVQQLIKSGGTTASVDRPATFLRQTLIGIEVGLTAVLLILAGTLTGSLFRVLNVEKGFAVEGVLTAEVSLPPQKYAQAPDRVRFYEEVRTAVRGLPAVQDAAWVSKLPLEGQAFIMVVNVPGVVQRDYENLMANYRYASPGYFQSIGIPLLQGRLFDESDKDKDKKVAVISETVARRVWPKDNPIGRQFHPGSSATPMVEVIGVVGDVRTAGLEQPPLSLVYIPYWQLEMPGKASLVARTSSERLGSLGTDVRRTIHSVDADVAVTSVRSMNQIVTDSVAGRRFQMLLAHLFSGFALFLAALGIYSVVSYSVEQRRYELGIRLALGSPRSGLRRLVMRQGMTPVLIGLVVGVITGFFAGRAVGSLFFGINAGNPLIISAVALVVIVIGGLACYIPATRTMGVDPMIALRAQ
ncbi:MAG: ABC transporter permease [Candidatus Sulfotelmatobacter sp.]